MSRANTAVSPPPFVPFGGISEQPPIQRFAHQVEAATNALFSIVDGFSKRPGTWFVRDLTAKLTGSMYRLFPVFRDRDEQYIIVYGNNNVASAEFYIVEIGGNNQIGKAVVSGSAQTYLDYTGPAQVDDLTLSAVGDSILIANRRVAITTTTSDAYTIERSWRDYDVLLSLTTTDGYYHRTEEDTDTQSAGYWQYDVDGITFAHTNLNTVSGSYLDVGGSGYWKTSGNNPMGFRVAFCRLDIGSLGTATWNGGTSTLSKTGAFTNYIFRAGDHCVIGTAVGGLAIGIYPVSSRTSNDAIVLGAAVAGATIPYTTDGFIGNEYEVVANFSNVDLADMQDVALYFQKVLRAAGATDACVEWYGRGPYGAFQITGPYRGSNAKIYLPAAPRTGSVVNLTAVGLPFEGSSLQIFNGTGSISNQLDTLPPTERWTRVAPPNQAGAKLSNTTMPMRMQRVNTSVTASVASYTIAADCEVTTVQSAHGMVTGQTVNIAGTTGSPNINGRRAITVTANNKFKFNPALNTTGGASSTGTIIAEPYFTVDVVDWNVRTSGDGDSNPAPDIITEGRKVADLTVFWDRLQLFSGPKIAASQSGDLFNFFSGNAGVETESDPLDLTLATSRVAVAQYAVHFRGTIIIFDESGQQFEYKADDALTPSTARAAPTTNFNIRRVRPVASGSELYIVGSQGSRTQLFEYRYDDQTLASNASDVTAHVPTLLPEDIRTMVVNHNNRIVLVVPEESDDIHVYRAYWSGLQKQQSAWSTYSFDNSYEINDAAILAERCYLLTKTANIWFIERLPLIDQPDDTHYDDIAASTTFAAPYTVHLDRKFYKATGTFAAGRTTWDLGVQTPASTINRAVKLSNGQEYTLTYWSGTTVGIDGVDLSATPVILGCAYTMSVELSRPFMVDASSERQIHIDTLIDKLTLGLIDTGDITVTYTPTHSGVATAKASNAALGTVETKEFSVDVTGVSGRTPTVITSTTARPCNVASVQWTLKPGAGIR